MELRQLRYFLAVAEELHFGRAAEKLHLSQPPLSVQVHRLEAELGVPLFERSTRRVALTPAGRHLRERAAALLAEFDAVGAEMRDFADGLSGQLTVGFVSSANYTVLPGVVRLFREHRPRVELSLVPLTSGEQLDRLRAGTLDVGIVRDEVPVDGAATGVGAGSAGAGAGSAGAGAGSAGAGAALSAEVVFEERLVACLPVEHPLASRSELTAEEVIALPMITYPRSLMRGYVERVSEVLAATNRSPRVVEEVVHQETALGFVAAGVGTTILPESVRQLLPPSIVAIPLAGSPTSRLLAVRSTRPDRAMIGSAFLDCLRDAAAALGRG